MGWMNYYGAVHTWRRNMWNRWKVPLSKTGWKTLSVNKAYFVFGIQIYLYFHWYIAIVVRILNKARVLSCTCIRGGSRIPRRRGRQPSRGAPTYNFPKKLHQIEKILGCLAPHFLRSATLYSSRKITGISKYYTQIWQIKLIKKGKTRMDD